MMNAFGGVDANMRTHPTLGLLRSTPEVEHTIC